MNNLFEVSDWYRAAKQQLQKGRIPEIYPEDIFSFFVINFWGNPLSDWARAFAIPLPGYSLICVAVKMKEKEKGTRFTTVQELMYSKVLMPEHGPFL